MSADKNHVDDSGDAFQKHENLNDKTQLHSEEEVASLNTDQLPGPSIWRMTPFTPNPATLSDPFRINGDEPSTSSFYVSLDVDPQAEINEPKTVTAEEVCEETEVIFASLILYKGRQWRVQSRSNVRFGTDSLDVQATAEVNEIPPDRFLRQLSYDEKTGCLVEQEQSGDTNETNSQSDLDVSDQELEEFRHAVRLPQPNSIPAHIAQRIASWGDFITSRVGDRLQNIVRQVPPGESGLEFFTQVIQHLFSQDEQLNWGQIVTLLYFGFLLVKESVSRGLVTAFRSVLSAITAYCVNYNIFSWIAAHGGWTMIQYLRLTPRDEVSSTRLARNVSDLTGFIHNRDLVRESVDWFMDRQSIWTIGCVVIIAFWAFQKFASKK
ncbi:BCL2-antagonist killer 1 [Cichlidogyrus casuarinus]|uniref:BCL2-antagonist killer 1 n=1 Tax=Cichlidogyrus casuarinus TaxID=1844966 RepID=A0ABD2Q1B3_9PLAT